MLKIYRELKFVVSLRLVTTWFVVLFVFGDVMLLSQSNPANGLICSNCDTLLTPFTNHTYSMGIGDSCVVEIHYKKRYCPLTGEYEVVLTSVKPLSNCAMYDTKTLFNQSLKILITATGNGLLNFPPDTNSTQTVRWRVSRPACVKLVNDEYIVCNTNCCTVLFEVKYNCDRKFSKLISRVPATCIPEQPNNSQSPGDPEDGCIHICDDKFLQK